VTPAFLRDMYEFAQDKPEWVRHAADLVLGAYFFAMRACEFCLTEKPGRTRRLTTANVVFRDGQGRVMSHLDKQLEESAMFVTVCFVDQKNGVKMEKRSHRRSGEKVLCPVLSWIAIISRIYEDIPISHSQPVSVCSYREGQTVKEIHSSQVLQILRSSCKFHGGGNKYGILPSEIGTRSIRSGAAMALALQGGSSDHKIMMLGRWRSTAFLNYIRPQVLEWAGDTAKTMANTIPFLDIGKQTSRQESHHLTQNHKSEVEFPRFTPTTA
jgi:outer membrane lipopolysaccharide assembly protein LptE/RlpB